MALREKAGVEVEIRFRRDVDRLAAPWRLREPADSVDP
jgi:hypothetical protein